MLWKLLIFYSGIDGDGGGGLNVKHGAPYGKKIMNTNMGALTMLAFCFLATVQVTFAETEYFPGKQRLLFFCLICM